MWAEAERGKARDSLYKVCAFLNSWHIQGRALYSSPFV